MSAPVQYGLKPFFGMAQIPPLPPGWTPHCQPMEFARAISPDGDEYLIVDDALYPYRVCPPEGIPGSSLKPGERYIDTEHPIPLPKYFCAICGESTEDLTGWEYFPADEQWAWCPKCWPPNHPKKAGSVPPEHNSKPCVANRASGNFNVSAPVIG